jgi:formate dehydrogenase subunit delta
MDARDTVRMANQIGAFFGSYSEEEALAGIADHINKFWEPRMRQNFFACMDNGGAGFSEIVKKAAVGIKRPATAD